MVREALIRQGQIRKGHMELHKGASRLRDFILGWQDGLVNVLGVILGVATATSNAKLVIISALAATFAESISMMAVAYTSFKAEVDFYRSELAREKCEIREKTDVERKEIGDIFRHLGFGGRLLKDAVRTVTSNKKRWLDMMMEYELKLLPPKVSPLNIAMVVGFSALIGSLIPVAPFLLMPVQSAVPVSLVVSLIVLFFIGVYKAKTTIGSPLRGGIEMALIGMMAALAGFAIGAVLGAVVTG